jgi:hypothetical protein
VKHIFTIIIGLSFIACNNSATNNKTDPTSLDKVKTVSSPNDQPTVTSSDKKATEIIVKNKADYSENFIKGLQKFGYKKIELIDSFLIIDQKDTVTFSMAQRIGEQIVYTGRQGNLAIALTITRMNYTTIDYKVEMVEFGKANHNESGQADIRSGFFLGAESNDDERTGEAYFVTEYINNKTKDCYTSIRLSDDYLGKIIKDCNGKIKDITLDNFTSLYRK